MFDFTTNLSNAASNRAQPFSGLPAHHFVGGNIDEPSVPVGKLADALGEVLRS